MSDDTRELVEDVFVQIATGNSSSDTELTLHGVSPATLYFSDRPERVVGHVTTEQFVATWGDGENSFSDDPPNAVLTFVPDHGELPDEAVVVLSEPHLSDGSVTYRIEVLEGAVPATSGACTLFIDPIGRPLSPVSVVGMRRRERRRMRRRMI